MNDKTEEKPLGLPFPTFLETIYEEERAIEMMLRAYVSGDQARVNELNDHILTLRKQSGMLWNTSEA